MEQQEILNLEVGTKEIQTLKPEKVKVEKLEIREISFGDTKKQKLVCFCKHPEKDDLIEISKVKYERQGKLETTGLWITLDSDGKIQKGSALAILLNYLNLQKPNDLIGKEIDTIEDEGGYLCFKSY